MQTNPLHCNPLPRREFLWRLGGGLGGIAFTHLLGQSGLLAETAELIAIFTAIDKNSKDKLTGKAKGVVGKG